MITLLWWVLLAVSAQAGVVYAADTAPVSSLSGLQTGTLAWEYDLTKGTVPPTATVQQSTTATGTFVPVATIPSMPATWPLPATADNLWYRIANAGGVSNVVQYVATPVTTVIVGPAGPAGPQGIQGIQGPAGTPADMTRVLALEQRVTKLETPTPTISNLSVVTVNPDQVTITGGNCLSLKTTGTGLQRIVTCVH